MNARGIIAKGGSINERYAIDVVRWREYHRNTFQESNKIVEFVVFIFSILFYFNIVSIRHFSALLSLQLQIVFISLLSFSLLQFSSWFFFLFLFSILFGLCLSCEVLA